MSGETISNAFVQRFSKKPRLFFSPGRINLIGEHVDYNDGFVMPAAIDKGIWYAIAPNDKNNINLVSYDLHEEYRVSLNEIKPIEGWQDYLLGVVDQIQKSKLIIGGFDCVFGGNLPVGAGLSSSAAVECGLLFGLNEIFNLQLDRVAIAGMAQKAEHTFPGVKCGIMDQFANMLGKLDQVILLDCRSLEYKYFPLLLEDYSLVLINTKVHHSLASGEYNLRRKQCAEGFVKLHSFLPGIESFRDLDPDDVEAYKNELGDVVYRRCLFVTQEIERTQKAADHLEKNEMELFGKLMYKTHQGLSKLYEVSCKELDFLVEKASTHPIVIGSRMMGGGFGGCTINLVYKNEWVEMVKEITDAYKTEFGIDAEVYEVATSNGTYEIL